MADPKKPPDEEADKTVVETRRPASSKPSAPVEPGEDDKTVVFRPPARDDKTTVLGQAPAEDAAAAKPSAGGLEAEQTVVRRSPAPSTAPGPAPARSAFSLVCLSGAERGKRFPLAGIDIVIGSDPGCGVVLSAIEKRHVRLRRAEDVFEIHPLAAPQSVTASRGQRKLRGGDLLRIGGTVLRLMKAGEVFSSDYSDAEFEVPFARRLLDPDLYRQNPRYLAIGGLVVLLGVLWLWPAPPPEPPPKEMSATEKQRNKEIAALLATGEVFFGAGKLMPPEDAPDAESAFQKFNEVLVLDPGNEKALAWLRRINEERERERLARQTEEERRRLAEQEEAERERQARLESEERERQAQEESDRRAREEEDARQIREREKIERRIAPKLKEAEDRFAKGMVFEPAGENALVLFQEILQIDPENEAALAGIDRVNRYYVDKGDAFRDRGDLWSALESYRRASRVTGGEIEAIETRVKDTVARLQASMSGTGVAMVIYKDEKGRMVILDAIEKVPPRYKDRAVEVPGQAPGSGSDGMDY